MITLYGFGGNEQILDLSPFVAKVAAYMRLANIPFSVELDQRNIKKSPKNKLPFINDNGTVVADSFFIIKYLKEKHVDLDANLSEEQKAQAHILQRALDEDFYWYIVYSRWQNDQGWAKSKDVIFEPVPKLLRNLVAGLIRKSIVKQLYQQGIGRHSEQEIQHLAGNMMQAISTQLGDKPYYFGDQVSSLDASLYAFLAQFINVDLYAPLHEKANSFKNLVEYTQRLHEQISS